MAKPTKLKNGNWRIRWVDENGVRRSKVFEAKSDAEFKLREYQTIAEQIRRGLKPKSAIEMSFHDLCTYWLEHRTASKRSPKDDHSIINAHLRPFFNK